MHIMKAIKRRRKSTNINYNLDESLKYSVKWKKSGKKKNIRLHHFYEHICNEFSTSKFIETESRLGVYQGRGVGE